MTHEITEVPVRYRFTPMPQGIQLEIWELASDSIKSDQPFLFRVKYMLPSRIEAEMALDHYLRNNGLSFADEPGQAGPEPGYRRLLSHRQTHS